MKKLFLKIVALLRIDYLANFVNQRSVREKFLILGFGGLVLVSLDYFLWLSPVIKTLTQSVPAYSAAERELQDLKDDKKNESEIRGRLERLQKDLEEREKGVESADQIDGLLENLSKQAARSGVRITSLNPLESPSPAKGSFYSALPIKIDATAGAHELGSFLSNLETGDTPFKIVDLKISENPANQKKHLVEMSVETYRKAGA